jgi:NitT/TauT family transport system permease protein
LGLNSRVSDIFQPIIQFLAAFPPNMLYPLVGSLIIAKGYNPNIWLSPLIILGTQWYILFNVIAGVRALPVDLLMMSRSFGLSQAATYRKVILPGILPSLLTGVITAAGGAWNTSIIAEVAQWENKVVYADGLGAYIMQASKAADTHLVCLGVAVMCLYVLVINRVVWLPLYRLIERRYGGA